MKKDIHPNYQKATVHCIACGNEFETGSTRKDIRVDTCSKCHSFYTKQQRFGAVAGRVDKFNKKYGIK